MKSQRHTSVPRKKKRAVTDSKQVFRHAAQLEVVNRISSAISGLQSFDQIMHLVFEQVQANVQLDVFYIALYDEKTGIVTFPILYDAGKFWNDLPKKIDQTVHLSQAIQTQQSILMNRSKAEIAGVKNSSNRLGDLTRVAASVIIIPLEAADRVIGGLSIQSYLLNAYNSNDVAFLSALAPQVTIAIENARLYEEIKINSGYLATLNELGRAVSELRDLPELLEIIYREVKKHLDAEVFFVGLYHPEKNTVSYPIMYDENIRYLTEPDQVTEHSFLYTLLHGGDATRILRTEAEIAVVSGKFGMLGNNSKKSASLMYAPLKVGEEVIGVISVQSYTLQAYTEGDLELLMGIANQVSIAIQNSRLYTSAQQEIYIRQKVEAQLRSAEAKYRELVESVPAVIYSSETGESGRWFFVSPQIEGLLGFTPDEWMADADLWFRQIHPEDREPTRLAEAQAIEAGLDINMEYRMYKKEGKLIWVRDESRYITENEEGKKVVQGTLTDITARKQAEITLKESEEKYHLLFLTAEQQARALALLTDIQSAITRELDVTELLHTVVEMTAQAFGYTFVSLYLLDEGMLKLQHQVGYELSNIIEIISPYEGISGRVLRTKQPVFVSDVSDDPDFLRADKGIHSEISVPLFSGDEIAGVFSVEAPETYPLTREDLRLLVLLGEQINIGLRRARLYAERADNLRREQHINEFAHAINSVLDIGDILKIVAKLNVEMIGAESGSISLMAEDGLRMINVYTYNDDLTLNAIVPRGQGLTWLVYDSSASIIVDEYAEHPDAMPVWVASGLHAFMGVPIQTNRKKFGVLAAYNRNPIKKFSARDLSLMEAVAQEVAIAIQNAWLYADLQKELEERKRVELEREAMYKDLEAKNAELERFTYTVSHDLKSPLVTIGGFLGFIEEDIKRGDLNSIVRSTERIGEAAKKMRRLLDELLELSRIGRLANPSVEVPFEKLAREAVELVQGELTSKQVEVQIEAGLPIVFVDKMRMVEVLQNLISNAIKFMGGQSQPVIEIGQKEINHQKVLFVRDNGIGIASEYHDRIFGLFNKLDQFSEGTGIGLTLVKRIIEVHGGKIWVESKLGKGATFFFTLADKKLQEKK